MKIKQTHAVQSRIKQIGQDERFSQTLAAENFFSKKIQGHGRERERRGLNNQQKIRTGKNGIKRDK